MRKERGISAKISEDYYRMMERTRHVLRKNGVKVNSQVKLTKMMSLNPPYQNKKWIQEVKRLKWQ